MSLTNDEITAKNFKEFYRKILPYLVRTNNGYSETPIGAMQMFDDNAAPSGWLVADGTVYNISDYPFLAKHFERVHGSKNYYGGDGTTTFAVPNWQGEFFRASGTNSHENQGSGGVVGEHQDATGYTTNVEESCNTRVENYDSIYTKGSLKYKISGSDPLANVSYYTARPTNTSLLCCIKAVPAGVNYSTEEQEIGTWIDGKPLYQKTITGSFPTHVTGGWTQTNLIPDIETIVNIVGWYGNNNEHRCTILEVGIIDSATGRVEIQTNNGRTLTAITLQYTKTTD